MKTFRMIVPAVICLSFISLQALQMSQADYEKSKAEAEKRYLEGSYRLAHESYSQLKAQSLNLPPNEARWVDFRVADTLWRAQAGTQTSDTTKYDQARQQLELLIQDVQRVEDRDRVWAEAQESLGDFHWTRRDYKNWGQALSHYQQALDWWAGARDLDLARERYLKIVWAMAKPGGIEPYYVYGYYGNSIPLEILDNALKIARTGNDKAHVHYLIAMTLRQQGGQWEQRQRVPEEFEAALKPGKATDWYDDALYHYAEWLANNGRVIPLENGQWRQEADYVKALELFRRLISEFQKGETRYYDQATQQVQGITDPVVGVSVSSIFLPNSEIQFDLHWRNVKTVRLTLHKVDLIRDVRFPNRDADVHNWIQSLNLNDSQRVKSWSKQTDDKGDHKPGQATNPLDMKLPAGAYILEAVEDSGSANVRGQSLGAANTRVRKRNQGISARDLILVTDTSLLLKTSGKQALAYFCNALDGSPIPKAKVRLWERDYDGKEWISKERLQETNGDGISVFELSQSSANSQLLAVATIDDRQAFSTGYGQRYAGQQDSWKIYAFTDRPAYRPGETVQWKFVARKYDGSVHSTPSQQTLEYQISDPRGGKLKEGKVTLNAFGSAWGSVELAELNALGTYQVVFWDEGRRHQIGSAGLFRLEEYKLPEFKVQIQTPEENGRKKSFRLGDKVEVNVQADYYFGGPVTNASIEILVYQNPFSHWWRPPREFPWYYEDLQSYPPNYYGHQPGQLVKQETLKTDATGRAVLSFETPRHGQSDFEYRIEARVSDASRREVSGSGTIRVTRQRYYVYPIPKHNLFRPQDKVSIDVKALDANNQPMQVQGNVKITRDYWYEVWLDPSGREVKGEELKRLRQRDKIFPPLPRNPGEKAWQLKFQGYQQDHILTRTVKTNAEGEVELSFTPEREGFYRIAWNSQDEGAAPIIAETTVRVATNSTTELGYRTGGVEIIVDRDTFRPGHKAAVMLSVPTQDRYVLFSVEGEDLYSYQLLHLTGTAKLVEIDLNEKHVPNVFLAAAMVSDRQIFIDTQQVIVPPVQHFLTVEVKADRNEYQPREEGTLTVTTRDLNRNPVSAEVALGLVDESVYYIQQDYAGDPRQFYYGTKRRQHVQTQSTFYHKAYARLVKGAENQLVDERQMANLGYSQPEGLEDMSAGGRVRGAIAGGTFRQNGMAQTAAPPSAAPMELRKSARSELDAMSNADAISKEAKMMEQEPAVQVRSDFRSTVLWQPDLVTGEDGKATVKVKYPESLTSWKSIARVATSGNQFGIATTTTRTQQPLIVRLQAPRFFLAGDVVTVSAVINNNTDKSMEVTPSLDMEGGLVPGSEFGRSSPTTKVSTIEVKPNSDARVDWTVFVKNPGPTKLKVTARNDQYVDAMEKMYLVYEHGIEKFISKSGKMRGNEITMRLEIPGERKVESTQLTVQVTPSLAVTMLDALPYLIDYPYGCTEQTMSRFLPAVITSKTLKDLGLQPEEVMKKVFGGIVPEHSGKTQAKGRKDMQKLDEMVKQGLDRLYDFQHSDGGWGWWKEGESDHFMTAYVVWGLALAEQAGMKIRGDVWERGVSFLEKEIVEEEENLDQQAWMLHALSIHHALSKRTGVTSSQAKALDNLWTHRSKLNAYTRSLLALSAHHLGYADKARTLIQNLENGVKLDVSPDASVLENGLPNSNSSSGMPTAHWGEDGVYWRWSEGGVEATSFALQALLAIDPENKLVEPVTYWLVKNRRGAQWSNTRDTAITVLALNQYLRKSGELGANVEYDLLVNGTPIASQKVRPADVLNAPSQFVVDARLIKNGTNEIRIRRKSGQSALYFSAQGKFFSLEEPLSAAGNEIFVRRQYYKLVPRPTLLKGYLYDKLPVNDGESVTSGQRIEAVITLEAKNNYEYLVFEDLKPAGLEAVQVRSGEQLFARELKSSAITRNHLPASGSSAVFSIAATQVARPFGRIEESNYTGRQRWVYQELRDRKVALFIDKLPEGVWEIRYDLRAEVPGKFHALPVMGHAMYVPEIRCNGAEARISVQDAVSPSVIENGGPLSVTGTLRRKP